MIDKYKEKMYGDELYEALINLSVLEPLTDQEPDMSIEDAYLISQHILNRRLSEGEKVVGKKIGVTSQAVMDMLEVDQPDFGFLTDAMQCQNGDTIVINETLIQPRAEGEIAFLLKDDLIGPGVTTDDVIKATEGVFACFEIVDSRIKDWKIKIQDTVADNASCGLFVLGDNMASLDDLDLSNCAMSFEKNGEVVATGTGAVAMNSPLNCVAWLANTLGSFGISLNAGDIILSGSLVPLIPASPGDHMRVDIEGIGSAAINFA